MFICVILYLLCFQLYFFLWGPYCAFRCSCLSLNPLSITYHLSTCICRYWRRQTQVGVAMSASSWKALVLRSMCQASQLQFCDLSSCRETWCVQHTKLTAGTHYQLPACTVFQTFSCDLAFCCNIVLICRERGI